MRTHCNDVALTAYTAPVFFLLFLLPTNTTPSASTYSIPMGLRTFTYVYVYVDAHDDETTYESEETVRNA